MRSDTNERSEVSTQSRARDQTSGFIALFRNIDQTTDIISRDRNGRTDAISSTLSHSNGQNDHVTTTSNSALIYDTETSIAPVGDDESSVTPTIAGLTPFIHARNVGFLSEGTTTSEETLHQSNLEGTLSPPTADGISSVSLPEALVSDTDSTDIPIYTNTEPSNVASSRIETDPTTDSCGHSTEQDGSGSEDDFTSAQEPALIQTNTTMTSTPDLSSHETTASILTPISFSNIWYSTNLAGFSLCRCSCSNISLDLHVRATKFTKLLGELGKFSFNTGLANRRKETAPDPRPSSAGIGLVASTLLAAIFFILLCSDCRHLALIFWQAVK